MAIFTISRQPRKQVGTTDNNLVSDYYWKIPICFSPDGAVIEWDLLHRSILFMKSGKKEFQSLVHRLNLHQQKFDEVKIFNSHSDYGSIHAVYSILQDRCELMKKYGVTSVGAMVRYAKDFLGKNIQAPHIILVIEDLSELDNDDLDKLETIFRLGVFCGVSIVVRLDENDPLRYSWLNIPIGAKPKEVVVGGSRLTLFVLND